MFFRFQKNFLNNFKLEVISQKKNFTFDRNIYICPEIVNSIFYVYTGNFFFKLSIKPRMLGFKLGDFIFTKKRAMFKISKKKKKK